jgi:hypothetical protein
VHRIRAQLALVTLAGLAGCDGDPHGLTWGVSFASEEDRSRAVYVEAMILEGGCDGTERYRTLFPVTVGTTEEAPPTLEAGHYCLTARASDGSCTWFVGGALEIDLPADQSPHVIALATPQSESECPTEECMEGRCEADVPDAGMDAPGDTTPGDTTPGDTLGDIISVDGCLTMELCNGADDDCDGTVDEGIDRMTDPNNCGTCGNACMRDLVCAAGSCGCPGSLTLDPPDRCRDLAVDPNHCGALDNRCEDDEWCQSSMCECRPGLTESGSACIDLTTDPAHCGMLADPCGVGEFCRSSICVSACMSGDTVCGSSCVDADADDLNCGGCGIRCQRSRICVSGSCEDYFVPTGCSACPCSSECRGDYDRCITYGGAAVCYDRDD